MPGSGAGLVLVAPTVQACREAALDAVCDLDRQLAVSRRQQIGSPPLRLAHRVERGDLT